MAQYQQWSRGYLKGIVREELMDPVLGTGSNGRWFSDGLLNYLIDEWQMEMQQDLDLVWGSLTSTVSGVGGNLLNPILTSTEGWVFGGNAIAGKADPLGGTGAYQLHSTTTSALPFNGLFPSTIVPNVITFSNTFTFNFWARALTTATNVIVEVVNLDSSEIEVPINIPHLSTSWQSFQGAVQMTNTVSSGLGVGISILYSLPGASNPNGLQVYNPSLTFSGQTAPVFYEVGTQTPPPNRLEAFYWNGQRLSGRLLEDLEVYNKEWRGAFPDSPRMVVQYDSTKFFIWPTPSTTGTLVQEYPILLSFVDDSSLVGVPFWCQYCAKPYICSRAYARPGPTNDLKRTLRYQKAYELGRGRAKEIWANYNPYRYAKLKPAGHYERDILRPPPVPGN